MGAGVIPFSVKESNVYFLFQTTFSGRKTGYFIDFGGGLGEGEDYRETAIREFIEETETMYLSEDLGRACRTNARVEAQVPHVEGLFDRTLALHPDWCCMRAPGKIRQPKKWKTFFIEFPYRDIDELNREWASDQTGRFKKRRKLFWLAADELLGIYENSPERLWKRVRQLENATEVIQSIKLSKTP